MRLKLAALLALMLLVGAAGCSTTDTAPNTANTNKAANTATTNTNSSTAPEVAKTDEGMVKANATPNETAGGTKEGCKCSAAGMACNSKDGKGGCCGKEGCSTMKDGKSSCCSTAGKEGAACCSTAGKTASNKGMGDMPMGCGTEKKPATTSTGKKS
ncbi:MAG TPA: hypothetical protein VGB17_12820 [Pyrinomonadaceae bacterium]|jgi:hypothetical protein